MLQVNELCHELAYRGMSEERRRSLSWAENTSINLGSGLTAGVAAAVLSQVCLSLLPPISFRDSQCEPGFLVLQPADTLLSQINKGHGPKGSMMYRLSTLAREAGFRGLFAGLGPRCLMTAGLVAGQFAIYGAIKDGELPFVLRICCMSANSFGGRDSDVCAARIGDS